MNAMNDELMKDLNVLQYHTAPISLILSFFDFKLRLGKSGFNWKPGKPRLAQMKFANNK